MSEDNELYERFGECRILGDLFDLAMEAIHVCGRSHPIDRERLLTALMDNRCQDFLPSVEGKESEGH